MNRSQRRRLLRRAAAQHKADGTYVPKPRRSYYQTAEIRDVVQSDILVMRQQIESQRRVRDRDWAFGRDTSGAGRSLPGLLVTSALTNTPETPKSNQTTLPFAALGLEPDATVADVRRAYRSRAREAHPDTGGSADAFHELQANYEQALRFVEVREIEESMR